MVTILAFLYFLAYILSFFVAEVVRFRFWIFQENHSPGMLLVFLGLAFVSGISIIGALKKLELLSVTYLQQIFYGTTFGVLSFLLFFVLEDVISEQRLTQYSDPQVFSELRGHCGAYIGRAILKYYYVDFDPTPSHLILDYEMSDRCRMDHFEDLKKKNISLCDHQQDEVQCSVKWMDIFAQKGFWNAVVRKMFLDEVLSVRSRERGEKLKIQEDSWYEYALKDHELESAHSGILKQAGIDEQFTDEYTYYRQKDELDNLKMTELVFKYIHGMIPEEPPISPGLIKFQDLEREITFENEKIPDLEKQVNESRKKINYNPSL